MSEDHERTYPSLESWNQVGQLLSPSIDDQMRLAHAILDLTEPSAAPMPSMVCHTYPSLHELIEEHAHRWDNLPILVGTDFGAITARVLSHEKFTREHQQDWADQTGHIYMRDEQGLFDATERMHSYNVLMNYPLMVEPYKPLLDDRPNRRKGKGKRQRDWDNR